MSLTRPDGLSFTWETIAEGHAGPGARSQHVLAFDPEGGATVLFGGILWVNRGKVFEDTWELRAGRWSPVEPRTQPAARHRSAMVADRHRGGCVLFGGNGDWNVTYNDTWLYRDGQWRRLRFLPWRHPSSRWGHAMAFDESAGLVVLFGGVGVTGGSLGDTWVFDGRAWERLRGPGPTPRRFAALAYDPRLGGCVLHGGANDNLGREMFGDAWLLRDGAWSQLPAGFDLPPRDDHALAFHAAAGRLVMLDSKNCPRGVHTLEANGWRPVEVEPMHPRHQCAPMAWDDTLGGLVLHGGEARYNGPQFDHTMVLRHACWY